MAIDPAARAPLGRSGVSVSRLGVGTGPATRGLERAQVDAFGDTIRRALALGLHYVDTAPAYHLGASEVVLGETARDADLVISTKVGRLVRPSAEGWVFDFSADGIRASVEDSLARLGLPRVDILMIHDPDDHMDQAVREAYPALRRMKDEGLVRAIGAGMVSAPPLARFVRETEMDCLLLAGRYTLLDQSALDELLPLCVERDVSVILGGVFNGGLLAGTSTALFNYAEAPPKILAAAEELAAISARHGVSLKAAAIQFPFAHPAVASVLSGTVAERHLVENAELLEVEIPAAFWDEIRARGHVREDAPLVRS